MTLITVNTQPTLPRRLKAPTDFYSEFYIVCARSNLIGNQVVAFTLRQRDTVLAFQMHLFSIQVFFFSVPDGGTKVNPVEQNHFQHIYPVE